MLRNALLALAATASAFAATPRPVASISIPTPEGKRINLTQFRGKVVLMVIFSTTCRDCIKSIDLLNSVQKQFGPQGFQVVGAAGDDNAQYLVQPFVQRYRPIFPVGYLTVDEMIRLGDIPKDKHPFVPIFLFIDKRGIVRFQYYGDDPFFKTEDGSTRSIIQGLLKQ